jgi:hypothetical protein
MVVKEARSILQFHAGGKWKAIRAWILDDFKPLFARFTLSKEERQMWR